MLRAIVLGAAAGGDFPQWNCGAPPCVRARAGDPAARPRTQSAVAVSGDGVRWWLLNASPDVRAQIAARPMLQPAGPGRTTPIDGVVLTSADVDHVAGLLALREAQPLALYATPAVHALLARTPVFDVLRAPCVARRARPAEGATTLRDADGRPTAVRVATLPLAGRGPVWGDAHDAAPVALAVAHADAPDATLLHVPGCAAITPALRRAADAARVLLFDGTVWEADEVARDVPGRTAAAMGHVPIAGPDGALAGFAGCRAPRRVFVHLNHTNPVLLADAPERAAVTAARWTVAEDGMDVSP